MNDVTKIMVRAKAMDLLAIREHSRLELQRKLQQRGYEDAMIVEVLDQLEQEKLQSDSRFAESYINMRARKGYGPTRIRLELQEKGLTSEFIDMFLKENSAEWLYRAQTVKLKKFGKNLVSNFAEKAKQMKFLQYRGFTSEQIAPVINNLPEE